MLGPLCQWEESQLSQGSPGVPSPEHRAPLQAEVQGSLGRLGATQQLFHARTLGTAESGGHHTNQGDRKSKH